MTGGVAAAPRSARADGRNKAREGSKGDVAVGS
jgi:hypothetical protein